jgi:hypothetical protein
MKITKSAMIVMKGRINSKNIYKLLRSTVVGGIASVKSESDCTVLWHMRLGHISEWGMLELYKKKSIEGCQDMQT